MDGQEESRTFTNDNKKYSQAAAMGRDSDSPLQKQTCARYRQKLPTRAIQQSHTPTAFTRRRNIITARLLLWVERDTPRCTTDLCWLLTKEMSSCKRKHFVALQHQRGGYKENGGYTAKLLL